MVSSNWKSEKLEWDEMKIIVLSVCLSREFQGSVTGEQVFPFLLAQRNKLKALWETPKCCHSGPPCPDPQGVGIEGLTAATLFPEPGEESPAFLHRQDICPGHSSRPGPVPGEPFTERPVPQTGASLRAVASAGLCLTTWMEIFEGVPVANGCQRQEGHYLTLPCWAWASWACCQFCWKRNSVCCLGEKEFPVSQGLPTLCLHHPWVTQAPWAPLPGWWTECFGGFGIRDLLDHYLLLDQNLGRVETVLMKNKWQAVLILFSSIFTKLKQSSHALLGWRNVW